MFVFYVGCWFNNKEILEQAKVMWKGLSDEIKNDYGEDYFEYKIRTMPEYNTPSVSVKLTILGSNVLVIVNFNFFRHMTKPDYTTHFQ